MLVRVSSKGQLVIPRAIRKALGLRAGTEMELQVAGHKIILEAVESASAAERLYGKFAGDDLLAQLESEHRHELENEPKVRS